MRKNVSPTQFGTTEAARNLATMLAEADNPVYLRKVARFLNNNFALIKTIDAIPDPVHRRVLARMVKRSILEAEMELPSNIKTHTINVATGRLRNAMDRWKQDNNSSPLDVTGTEFDFRV